MLQNKARDAVEKGESPEDEPGMAEVLQEMEAKKV